MANRSRDDEWLVVQRRRRESLHLHGQREDAHVDVAGAQSLQHGFGLMFVEQQVESRQCLAQ